MSAVVYRFTDRLSGVMIMVMVVAAPWLFGTTEVWSMNLLNGVGYCIGALLCAKWLLRWTSGALAVEVVMAQHHPHTRPGAWMVRAMAALTVAVLFYSLISALNARATFITEEQRFEYHPHIAWLPFTYDSRLTWRAFGNYFALACLFWGIRDWLVHPTDATRHTTNRFPRRFLLLFTVLTMNGTILALEGIFQRLLQADQLLWFRTPYDGRADLMFGPFVFRDNAAQFFNMVWPAILAFWWLLRETARTETWNHEKIGGRPHMLLLPCAIIVAATPLVAASVSGSVITALLMIFAIGIFFLSNKGTWRGRCTIVLVFLSVIALGGALGWDQLAPRLRDLFQTAYTTSNPSEPYQNARQMALDYPLFGVGPGAFRALYQLYRSDPQQTWHAFLHDDWLEMRVTFGWVGSMLILCLLCLALTRWFVPGGITAPWEFIALLWAAVGGCLANAKFSFPLQVYSLLVTILVLLAVLSSLSQPENPI